MYYIYADEAGTSAKEPITVVTAVVMHADKDWKRSREALSAAIREHVPTALQQDFIFHAKDVRNAYRKYDDVWPLSRRNEFIGAVAAIPRLLGLAVCVSKVRRDCHFPIDEKVMKLHDFQHFMAFGSCMRRANKYIKDWSDPSEVATLVAEDVRDKRKFLKRAMKIKPFKPSLEHIRLTQAEIEARRVVQTWAGEIDRIIDTVHFCEKDEAPLLQLADACAFCFRRYFAGEQFGEQLVEAMLGYPLVWAARVKVLVASVMQPLAEYLSAEWQPRRWSRAQG